jgi:hypothetical protein
MHSQACQLIKTVLLALRWLAEETVNVSLTFLVVRVLCSGEGGGAGLVEGYYLA